MIFRRTKQKTDRKDYRPRGSAPPPPIRYTRCCCCCRYCGTGVGRIPKQPPPDMRH